MSNDIPRTKSVSKSGDHELMQCYSGRAIIPAVSVYTTEGVLNEALRGGAPFAYGALLGSLIARQHPGLGSCKTSSGTLNLHIAGY